MLITVIILSTLLLILIVILINLLRKNEKQEQILADYLDYLDKLSKQIEYTDVRLAKIDTSEVFKSDDEIGWFFEEVKRLQSMLNNFKIFKENIHAEEGSNR